MPKRKSVSEVKTDYIEYRLKNNGWSNAYFGEKIMEKGRGWITEWKRGKNLPSPEEAARMCAILQVTPEEILTDPADIELVQSLIDSQRPAQKEKADLPKEIGLSPARQKLIASIDELSDEQCEKLLGIIEEAKKLL